MSFADRVSAGKVLAEKVVQFLDSRGLKNGNKFVVIGLPRGGVPVALEVARRLSCPVDIIVSKKLPYPGQPEFAIGAVSSDGVVMLNPEIPNGEEWQEYVEQERQRLLKKTVAVENRFYDLSGRKRITSYRNKVAIVIDDGVATGMTAIAALETARLRGADVTIAAAPVMSRDSFYELKEHCDGVVACETPHPFQAVGLHYLNFNQTSDEEVVEALRKSAGFGSCDLPKQIKNGANSVDRTALGA